MTKRLEASRREPSRLALFGGVYANLPALEAVLADITVRGSAPAWCLGDLGGFGPEPEECVTLLRERAVPTVQGNHDHSIGHRLADCACGYTDPEDERFAQVSYDFTDARISDSSREWLRARPAEARLTFAGRRVLLCHGSPRRSNEFLWESACSDAFLARLCAEHAADVLVCTHTGLPWHRALPGGAHVVNAGAIGRPAHDGRPGAWYAELESRDGALDVRFRHVTYDHLALAARMDAAGLPPEFSETVRTGRWTTCFGSMPVRERLRATEAVTARTA
jgi:diadenosine tetraphosphatase ApaH/serine/threonine PP2A family protein phosphatase